MSVQCSYRVSLETRDYNHVERNSRDVQFDVQKTWAVIQCCASVARGRCQWSWVNLWTLEYQYWLLCRRLHHLIRSESHYLHGSFLEVAPLALIVFLDSAIWCERVWNTLWHERYLLIVLGLVSPWATKHRALLTATGLIWLVLCTWLATLRLILGPSNWNQNSVSKTWTDVW